MSPGFRPTIHVIWKTFQQITVSLLHYNGVSLEMDEMKREKEWIMRSSLWKGLFKYLYHFLLFQVLLILSFQSTFILIVYLRQPVWLLFDVRRTCFCGNLVCFAKWWEWRGLGWQLWCLIDLIHVLCVRGWRIRLLDTYFDIQDSRPNHTHTLEWKIGIRSVGIFMPNIWQGLRTLAKALLILVLYEWWR